MARKYPSLESWAHKRIITVPLDEQTQVDFRLPDLGVWIAQGKIPNPLKPIALKLDSITDVGELPDDEQQKFFELQAFIIATHTVKPNLVKECGGVEEAVEWVLSDDGMPPEHRGRLWLAALHISPELLAKLTDLGSFREERPGAEPPEDSHRDIESA